MDYCEMIVYYVYKYNCMQVGSLNVKPLTGHCHYRNKDNNSNG